VRALRLHYRPLRYLLSRWAGRRGARLPLSRLGFISYDEVEPPTLPGPEWVRVDCTLSGICGSDLSAITAHDSLALEPFQTYPFTFGHENVGRIAEVGAAVDGWRAGDRVVVHPMLACAQRGLEPVCPACARGEYGLCRRTTEGEVSPGFMIGYCARTGGGWSRSFVAHRSQLHAPGALPDELAVLTDPFASALRPVLLHPPAEEDVVLVIGAGTIGLLTVKALRLAGWTGDIAVSGRYNFQLELAERAGATRLFRGARATYDWAASLPVARSYKPTLAPRFIEGGPSLIYDTVGSQGSIGDALALVREGGRVIIVGAPARLTADWTRVVVRQLSLAGVFAYGPADFDGRRRDSYDIALELLQRDGVAELGIVSHVFPLEDYRAALSAALDKDGSRSVKVAFRPGD
jgi:L-iditol 2-dehydrogenase